MVLSVVDRHLDVVHPVARNRARFEDLTDALLDRWHELRRDDPAHDVVDELEALPACLRLDPQEDLSELAGASGLLLVAMVPLGGGGDGLAVGNAGRASLHLDVVALLHSLKHHAKVRLSQTVEHRLPRRGAVLDVEARVLGRELREGVGELLLVAAGLRLDGKPVHRLGQGDRLGSGHVVTRVVQHRSVADLVHLRDGADVARPPFVDLHVLPALQAEEVPHLKGLRPSSTWSWESRVTVPEWMRNAESLPTKGSMVTRKTSATTAACGSGATSTLAPSGRRTPAGSRRPGSA